MQEIGSGPNYRVEVDTATNRIYLRFIGDIVSDAQVTGLPEAVKVACAAVKPQFTTLADFTEMKLLGLPDVVQQLQMTLLNAGLRKLASVWDHETFAKMVVDSAAQKVKSGEYSERRKVFKNRIEAEAWLSE
jgi:hypothetical protein